LNSRTSGLESFLFTFIKPLPTLTHQFSILGTDPRDIDKAEDRQKFSEILDSIGVDQPAWKELTSVADAEAFADEVSYPVLVGILRVVSSPSRSFRELCDVSHLPKYVSCS
jgi:hypothetical protein